MEDPTELSALTWRARKASLLSHHIPADDPRLQAADWGLKYWQTRTTFDRAASDGVIEASLRDTLLDGLLAEARAWREAAEAAEPEAAAPAPETCDQDSAPLSDGSVAQPDRTAEEVPVT